MKSIVLSLNFFVFFFVIIFYCLKSKWESYVDFPGQFIVHLFLNVLSFILNRKWKNWLIKNDFVTQ